MCYRCMSITHHRNQCNVKPIIDSSDTETEKQKDNVNAVDQDNNISISTVAKEEKHFTIKEQEELDDACNFKIVKRKSKERKERTVTEVNKATAKIPESLKCEVGKNFVFNNNTFETEMMIIGSKLKFSYGGKDYPKGNIHGRLVKRDTLKILRQGMGKDANRKIEEILKESNEHKIQLKWFLIDNRLFFKANFDQE